MAAEGAARAGTLLTRHGPIHTPTALVYTRRGGCMYLTPDMVEKLRPRAEGVQINAVQLLEQPSAAQLARSGGSLHRYIGLPRWPLLAANRDPTLQEYSSGKPSKDSGAYALIHSGGQLVTPTRYMEVIKAIQPELFVALADEVTGDVTKKRVVTSVERTLRWLDHCIAEAGPLAAAAAAAGQQQQQQPAAGAGSGEAAADGSSEQPAKRQRLDEAGAAAAGSGAADAAAAAAGGGGAAAGEHPVFQVLAPVMGGSLVEERARAAQAVADKPVAGFALCGFGMGEDPALHSQLLDAAVGPLPAGKPRLLLGMATPEEVLTGVLHGGDLFDCGYPTHATLNGYALCFPLRPGDAEHACGGGGGGGGGSDAAGAAAASGAAAADGDAAAEAAAHEGYDGSKINLWSQAYRLDKRPLAPGCSCFACTNHSRAYIHHLVHSHEMLASVLLEVHNTHWWLEYFQAIREALAAGQLCAYAAWFRARQRRAQGWPAEGAAAAGGEAAQQEA